MENYLSMMMCICSIFLRMINTVDAEDERDAIWRYLKENNSDVYRRVRHSVLNMGTNLPTNLGTQDRHHRVPCCPEDFQVQLSVKRKGLLAQTFLLQRFGIALSCRLLFSFGLRHNRHFGRNSIKEHS